MKRMADNEDPKEKAVTGTAPKTVVTPAAEVPVVKAKVAEPKPADVKPVEAKLAEAKPVAAKAPETKEPEAKPVEAAPVVTKPVEAAPAVAKPADPAPVKAAAAPAKPEPAAKPAPVAAKVAPVKAKPVVKAKPAPVSRPAPKVEVKATPPVAAKPAPAPVPVEPVVPVKAPVAEPVVKATKDEGKAAPAVTSPKAAAPKAAPKTASNEKPVFAGLFTNFMLEETKMDMSANFTGLQDAFTEAQAKAKAAFEKSSSMLGEVSEFAKGNAEAVVESGKIFAEGVQGLGSELVAESRTAFETLTGDIKEMAAAKSPTDFFKIQGDVVRKNFDSAVAYSSKNSEAMLKLMNDVFAPISGRVSIAMEKARSASL